MNSAQVMFLDVQIPDDDPLAPAKAYVNNAAPGFRLFEKDDRIQWESDFIWLVIINEEDGLDFKVKQTTDGKREVHCLWNEQELNDITTLQGQLKETPLWDVFRLRAIVLVQNRVDEQIDALRTAGQPNATATVRKGPLELAGQLHKLELDMLRRATATLEDEVRTNKIDMQTHVHTHAGPAINNRMVPPGVCHRKGSAFLPMPNGMLLRSFSR